METGMIAAILSASPLTQKNQLPLIASSFKPVDQHGKRLGIKHSANMSFSLNRTGRKPLVVQARDSDGESSNSTNAFVGGFVMGGIIMGALGCVFAPQISKTLSGTEGKEFMRKLPKFIYDEEKEMEKNRKRLTEKIEQLNDAIDDVSGQLRPGDDLDMNSG